MAKSKRSAPFLSILLVGVVLVALGGLWTLSRPSTSLSQDACPRGKVCLSETEYQTMQRPQVQVVERVIERPVGPTRDYRVLHDPLYPPLNRTDTRTHDELERNIHQRTMYVPTQDTQDTYRLVGYLVNKDTKVDMGGNAWKLFARQKDRHTSDFYMVPANNNYDIKIPIKDDMVEGTRLRDVYTIPNELKLKSPMLNDSPYEFMEHPKSDLTSPNYI